MGRENIEGKTEVIEYLVKELEIRAWRPPQNLQQATFDLKASLVSLFFLSRHNTE